MSENADNVAPESTNVYASIPEDGLSGLSNVASMDKMYVEGNACDSYASIPEEGQSGHSNDASMDKIVVGEDACDTITDSESGETGVEAGDSECNTLSPSLGPSSSDVYASISDTYK